MEKYRKKPVEVEAVQFTEKNKDQVFNDIGSTQCEALYVNGKPALKIHTLEGDMVATIGDFIIKGMNGEFYPCKPDIFAKTYDKVVPPSQENEQVQQPAEPQQPQA